MGKNKWNVFFLIKERGKKLRLQPEILGNILKRKRVVSNKDTT